SFRARRTLLRPCCGLPLPFRLAPTVLRGAAFCERETAAKGQDGRAHCCHLHPHRSVSLHFCLERVIAFSAALPRDPDPASLPLSLPPSAATAMPARRRPSAPLRREAA